MSGLNRSAQFEFILTPLIVGVKDGVKESILASTSFTLGSFPMRYLGLPLSHKNEITWLPSVVHEDNWKDKSYLHGHLSYAGKVQVINFILFLIYNFWSSMFILP